MYSDVITPKSYPDKLQDPAYDPFDLMPGKLAAHPRVFYTPKQRARVKKMTARVPWAKAGLALLREKATCDDLSLPDRLDEIPNAAFNNRLAGLALRNALAAHLTGEKQFHERALRLFRLLADAYPRWPLKGDNRGFSGGLNESHTHIVLGWIYDLLAAMGLANADERLFRNMLDLTEQAMDGNSHRTCGNHNSWCLAGRLSIALALGDRRRIHDALYGCQRNGLWRYGIIHQLRHDFLSDGMHWERTLGYHYYTLMGFTEMASMLANSGVDLWHRELPSQNQNDGNDIHRAYGPAGAKCLKAAYDAPFYLMTSGGEFMLIHDSGLSHWRGIHIWGIVYDKAYEAYRDPKYAWLLNRMEKEYPPERRQYPNLPMSLNTHSGEVDFARRSFAAYPAGRFSLARDTRISLAGIHRRACTLMPVQGTAILRSSGEGNTTAAALNFAPHTAGHMAPAVLHLGLHAGGWRRTDAPRLAGYEDPIYLTWGRTTIAHNTVTVDESSMFPYDFATDSIWECDHWRDRISDSRLALFQTDGAFKAMRAINDRVYEGVRLDRTVILDNRMILDVFRVIAGQNHIYDWAIHGVGEAQAPAGTETCRLGTAPGYRHLIDIRKLPNPGRQLIVEWRGRRGSTRVQAILPPRAGAYLAKDPVNGDEYGELGYSDPRTALIVRTAGRQCLFVALWTLDAMPAPDLKVLAGIPDRAVVIETALGGKRKRWHLPFADEPVSVGSRR